MFEFEGDEIVWDGMLTRYEGTGLDTATRTAPVRVLVENPRHARLFSADGQSPLIRPDGGRLIDPPSLLSGMFVKVRIPIESRQELLRIPTEALRPHGEVWAVVDQKLQKVTVDVARELDDFVLLRAAGSPITAGAQVITSPLATVRNGMPVTSEDASLAAERPSESVTTAQPRSGNN